ncbi:MAG TPA: 50S ribosomal protein L10 [Desulfatiglandales bacterium]|nr:50S ribosomal protein L10 [Desulfatiglandales bacterium]
MNREEKKKVITGLKERLEKACGAFLVDYRGLNVEALTRLRRELGESNIDFQVVKNRLLSIASQDTETAVLRDYLTGPCALALTYDDVVQPAKILTKFIQGYENIEIKIGQINGKAVELSAIKKLAQLPSREALLSQLLLYLSSVPTSFVRQLSEMIRQFVTVLKAIEKQKA